ncbi:hypothetical protein D3C71_1595200 [compost metagenome]
MVGQKAHFGLGLLVGGDVADHHQAVVQRAFAGRHHQRIDFHRDAVAILVAHRGLVGGIASALHGFERQRPEVLAQMLQHRLAA